MGEHFEETNVRIVSVVPTPCSLVLYARLMILVRVKKTYTLTNNTLPHIRCTHLTRKAHAR